MCKPFLTISQQMGLLESRGVVTDGATASILMRDGYYSVVNGYKEPFIDDEKTSEAGDDRYVDGTEFKDLYDLFSFDRLLRLITFRYLIMAEATAKTAIAHCFADAHRDPDDYLLQANYCTRKEFGEYGKKEEDYATEVNRLIGILSRRRDKSSTDFIAHYRSDYGKVPIWVLCNDLTFGNMEHFFNLMKPREKEAVCKMIAEGTGRLGDKVTGYFDVQTARVSLEVLVKFRNICAHDERLYCAHVGDRKNVNFAKMVWMLERYLTNPEFFSFLDQLNNLIQRYDDKNGSLGHILSALGFPELLSKIEERIQMLEKGNAEE